MKHSKIAIIGTGNVGSTIAYALMLRNMVAEILLIDINEQRCRGEQLDLSDALTFSTTSTISSASFEDARTADIIIIAAGKPQLPDQPRTELARINQSILTSTINKLQPLNPQAIIIVVSNPVDLLTLHIQNIAGLPKNQIFGTGTFLDSQRLRTIIADKLNIAEQSIHAYILGEHGDSQFVAWSSATIGGVPLANFAGLTDSEFEAISKTVRNRAYEIIACKGSTFYGIAACVTAMCQNILFDQKRVLPLSCFIPELDTCLSMPVVLGEGGIERILPVCLNKQEKQLLEQSASGLKALWGSL